MSPFRCALLFSATLYPAVAHADAHLNVKPGLWETTVVIAMDGIPSMPESRLESMPPQQRAQMEAAMARMSQPRTEKSCITAEQIKKGPDFSDRETASCTRKVTVNSGNEWGTEEECTGAHPRTVKTHFKALTPETISGQSDVEIATRGKTMTSKATFQGKWLGASCGSIKPTDTDD